MHTTTWNKRVQAQNRREKHSHPIGTFNTMEKNDIYGNGMGLNNGYRFFTNVHLFFIYFQQFYLFF